MLARTTIAAGLATGVLALGAGLVPAIASPPARTAPQTVRAAVADPPSLTATLARSL
jgi:hypothetical protein